MLVGPQVVDPQPLGPGLLACRLAVEEQHIGLDALGVEDARQQAQHRVHVEVPEQPATERLPDAALEQHVVRYDDGCATVDVEDRRDVLDQVQLLVRGRHDEVAARSPGPRVPRGRRHRPW